MLGALLTVRHHVSSLPIARLRASYRKSQQNACAATEPLRDLSGLREHAALLIHIAQVLLTYTPMPATAACRQQTLATDPINRTPCMPSSPLMRSKALLAFCLALISLAVQPVAATAQ